MDSQTVGISGAVVDQAVGAISFVGHRKNLTNAGFGLFTICIFTAHRPVAAAEFSGR